MGRKRKGWNVKIVLQDKQKKSFLISTGAGYKACPDLDSIVNMEISNFVLFF